MHRKFSRTRDSRTAGARQAWCWAVIAFGIAGSLEAEPLVFARSTVNKDYEAARAARGLTPETYVFYRGNFFEGQVVDRTLERMPFVEIVRILAPHLKEQRYLPARQMSEADLVLVVHWGVTIGRNPADALASINSDNQTKFIGAGTDYDTAFDAVRASGPDVGNMDRLREAERRVSDLRNERVAEADLTHLSTLGSTSNAALLGFSDVLREESQSLLTSTTMGTINAMLDEDRYFIIVMAYDRRALADGKAAKRLWTARISMRSAGMNFREAVGYLAGIGGELFGTNSEKMLIQKARRKDDSQKQEQIMIGELRVIESTPPKP